MPLRIRCAPQVLATLAAAGLAACSGNQSIPFASGSAAGAPVGAGLLKSLQAQPGIAAVAHQPPVPIQIAFLLTDGTVMGQSAYSNNQWYRYTPDSTGSYLNGTWAAAASLPAGYSPSAYASAVMIDGRLAIVGGEYNAGGPYQLQLTNLAASYDPVKNTWTALGHPNGWKWIGDSPSTVLPDGRLFVGQKLTKQGAVLDPKTLQWSIVGTTGKSDFNSEEGYTLLPDGTILTEDVKHAPHSERYNPTAGTWTSAGSTIVDLHSPSPYKQCIPYGPKQPQDCYLPPGEIGPAVLRPDGTVFATGSASGASGSGPGHTAIFHPSGNGGSWTVGPDFPNGDNAGDSYAVGLPSGNVLVFGNFGGLYEFNGSGFVNDGSVTGVPLLLPTGQVMMFGNGVSLFTGKGTPKAAWAPTISGVPASLSHGKTYKISGTQFNGLSQAIEFGDEDQNPTNYPLVRITNVKTGHIFYARTHDHSTMAVATGKAAVSTNFDVPAKIELGPSTIQVIANGIPSKPTNVTVQ